LTRTIHNCSAKPSRTRFLLLAAVSNAESPVHNLEGITFSYFATDNEKLEWHKTSVVEQDERRKKKKSPKEHWPFDKNS